jgi:hypothetical protein
VGRVFKVHRIGSMTLILGVVTLFAGCANLSTISRSTSLETPKAVHLDIQQRLLILNAAGKYCSEPSPDGLAAFAAAAGIGASTPASGALSASGSAGSSAASIGLRTQSITLMRDALYRICEAYGNGMLEGAQVMAMLSRSQDLSAVVLATEQLTGAVVAQQAALSSTAASDATAVMTSTAPLMKAALDQQALAQDRLEKAMAKKAEAEAKQKEAQDEHRKAQTNRDNNTNGDAAEQEAITRLEKARRAEEAADRQVELAEDIRALRKETLTAATERVEALKLMQDSAATTAAASSASSAALSGGGVQSRLSDQSTQAIAVAISGMVNNVLNKSYVTEYCMAMISSKNYDPVKEAQCWDVINAAVTVEGYRVTGSTNTFLTDTSDLKVSNCIKSWLNATNANKAKLDNWRKQNGGNIDHVLFMFDKSASSLRSAAVNDLSISCN